MNLTKKHKEKFAKFIEMCNQMGDGKEADIVIIHHPAVLGDNYEEIITNLDLLAEAELKLVIVPPGKRALTDG